MEPVKHSFRNALAKSHNVYYFILSLCSLFPFQGSGQIAMVSAFGDNVFMLQLIILQYVWSE